MFWGGGGGIPPEPPSEKGPWPLLLRRKSRLPVEKKIQGEHCKMIKS